MQEANIIEFWDATLSTLAMLNIWGLKRYYRSLKRGISIIVQKYPCRIQCNICGWKGRIFSSDGWHPHTICPNCGSQVRHRLLFAAFTTLATLGTDAIVKGKRVLHFAPEEAISASLKDCAGNYVTADLCRDDVDMRLDMCNMSGVADGSFDLVVACDVLEHVPDDSAALREVYRVLSAQGWAIITVPQKDNLSTKYEDPTIVTPQQRTLAFGQDDHLRIYGDDFSQFVEANGYTVTVVDEHSFDYQLVKRHVLFPPVLSVHPLATNHRKIYFAKKRSA
jgi:SAM-dependent methyltransferase